MTRSPLSPGLPTLALVAALANVACSKASYTPYKPYKEVLCTRSDLSGCVIQDVSVTGGVKVPEGAVKDKIATAETSRSLLGLLENVPILSLWDRITVDYEKLDPFVLERDLARVERIYRARGYYEAHARAARVTRPSKDRLRIEIVVDEGAPVLVGGVHLLFDWGAGGRLPPSKVLDAVEKATAPVEPGATFSESLLEDARKSVARALTDQGYAYATVEAKAKVDLGPHRAEVSYEANLGPLSTFGAITVEGAGDLPLARIRKTIRINEGEPYSTAKLDSAQGALTDLRVFGTVDVAPQLAPPDRQASARPSRVPVVFRVTQTALKTGKAGFGFEVGDRVAVHGVAGWENRNFLGGLRALTLEAKPGFVLYPYTLASIFQTKPDVLPELRVHTALAQPGFVEARTRGLVSADFNMYQLQPTGTLGYIEVTNNAGVEREWWGRRVHVGVFAKVQFDQPVDLTIPVKVEPTGGGYNFLVIPYAQFIGTLDLRYGLDGKKRDPINPHSGIYLANDFQIAVGPGNISSTDLRERVELRGYIPVTQKLTIALRFAGGVLFPFGGALAQAPDTAHADFDPTLWRTKSDKNYDPVYDAANYHRPTGCKPVEPPGEVCRGRYIQVLQLRGFTSGGTNSNRGYAYNSVGQQEQIPGISALSAGRTGVPIPLATGGMALWEASVELRFPVYEKWSGTIFLDGSDVRDKLADLGAPFAPHLSTGFGIRYATPVGALRADVGLRIPGAQVIGLGVHCAAFDPSVDPSKLQICQPGKPQGAGSYIDEKYGQSGSIAGAPLTLSLAIGEAF